MRTASRQYSQQERRRRMLERYISNPRLRRWVIQLVASLRLAGVVVVPVGAIAVAWLGGNRLIQNFYMAGDAGGASAVQPAAWNYDGSTEADASELELFLESYLMQRGGLEKIRQFGGFEFDGSILEIGENTRHIFDGRKFRTGDFAMTLLNSIGEPTLRMHRGELNEAWAGVVPEVRSAARYLAEVFDPIVNLALSREGRIERISPRQWEGVRVLEVVVRRPGSDHPVMLYLDEANLRIVGRVDHSSSGLARSFRFNDYREVEGFEIPYLISVQEGEEPAVRISLREVEAVDPAEADAYASSF